MLSADIECLENKMCVCIFALSFLSLFWDLLVSFLPAWIFLAFSCVFPFFSSDFRGSVRIQNPVFFWEVFRALQVKERQGIYMPTGAYLNPIGGSLRVNN